MFVKSVRSAKNLAGKRVLLRSDLNVPIVNGVIKEEYKLEQGLKTIEYLLKMKCRVILLTHLGEPTVDDKNKFSIKPIAKKLSVFLNKEVKHIPAVTGFKAETAASKMKNGEIIMLENVRFEAGEKKNDKKFARSLAQMAEIYVNDAFAVSHRAHASVSAIKSYLPSYAGLLLEEELDNLNRALKPQKPLVAVIGGAKISTKINLLKKLSKKSWRVLVGGGIANNFFAAEKIETGKSLVDSESVYYAKKLKADNLVLPVDVIVSNDGGAHAQVKTLKQINKNDYIFDIGPETIRLYAGIIKKANTIIWNGPMGKFEFKPFREGTLGVARTIASRTKGKAFGIVGGGETVEALKITKMEEYIDWVSTGGGAMLSYLGGEKMPGLVKLIK
jgi:phosphoglycerate kinase